MIGHKFAYRRGEDRSLRGFLSENGYALDLQGVKSDNAKPRPGNEAASPTAGSDIEDSEHLKATYWG